MLEVIDKGSYSESDSTPLLFVHGAAHAAWCWVGTEPLRVGLDVLSAGELATMRDVFGDSEWEFDGAGASGSGAARWLG
jgi:hypothetical protein